MRTLKEVSLPKESISPDRGTVAPISAIKKNGCVKWRELENIFRMSIYDLTVYDATSGRITIRDIHLRDNAKTEICLPERSFLLISDDRKNSIEACWL